MADKEVTPNPSPQSTPPPRSSPPGPAPQHATGVVKAAVANLETAARSRADTATTLPDRTASASPTKPASVLPGDEDTPPPSRFRAKQRLPALQLDDPALRLELVSEQSQQLNAKLVASITHHAQLEDQVFSLEALRETTDRRVEDLEREKARWEDSMNTGLLVERAQIRDEMQRLAAGLVEEERRRGSAEERRAQVESEVDELTSSLFDQANTMVASERMSRAQAEEKLRETQDNLAAAEAAMRDMQTHLQALTAISAENTATSPQPTVLILTSHPPYQEFKSFIRHLRAGRPPKNRARSPYYPVPIVSNMLSQPFLARMILEDHDPTLRLETAANLSWLNRRSIRDAIFLGDLLIEPVTAAALGPPEHICCTMCGHRVFPPPPSHHGQRQTSSSRFSLKPFFGSSSGTSSSAYASENVYVFRIAAAGEEKEKPYPLCRNGWCLERLRAACALWHFIRTGIIGPVWLSEDRDVAPSVASIATNATAPAILAATPSAALGAGPPTAGDHHVDGDAETGHRRGASIPIDLSAPPPDADKLTLSPATATTSAATSPVATTTEKLEKAPLPKRPAPISRKSSKSGWGLGSFKWTRSTPPTPDPEDKRASVLDPPAAPEARNDTGDDEKLETLADSEPEKGDAGDDAMGVKGGAKDGAMGDAMGNAMGNAMDDEIADVKDDVQKKHVGQERHALGLPIDLRSNVNGAAGGLHHADPDPHGANGGLNGDAARDGPDFAASNAPNFSDPPAAPAAPASAAPAHELDLTRASPEPANGSPMRTSPGPPISTSAGPPVGMSAGSPMRTSAGPPVGTPVSSPMRMSAGPPVGTLASPPVGTSAGPPVGTPVGSPLRTLAGPPVGATGSPPAAPPIDTTFTSASRDAPSRPPSHSDSESFATPVSEHAELPDLDVDSEVEGFHLAEAPVEAAPGHAVFVDAAPMEAAFVDAGPVGSAFVDATPAETFVDVTQVPTGTGAPAVFAGPTPDLSVPPDAPDFSVPPVAAPAAEPTNLAASIPTETFVAAPAPEPAPALAAPEAPRTPTHATFTPFSTPRPLSATDSPARSATGSPAPPARSAARGAPPPPLPRRSAARNSVLDFSRPSEPSNPAEQPAPASGQMNGAAAHHAPAAAFALPAAFAEPGVPADSVFGAAPASAMIEAAPVGEAASSADAHKTSDDALEVFQTEPSDVALVRAALADVTPADDDVLLAPLASPPSSAAHSRTPSDTGAGAGAVLGRGLLPALPPTLPPTIPPTLPPALPRRKPVPALGLDTCVDASSSSTNTPGASTPNLATAPAAAPPAAAAATATIAPATNGTAESNPGSTDDERDTPSESGSGTGVRGLGDKTFLPPSAESDWDARAWRQIVKLKEDMWRARVGVVVEENE